MPHLSTNVTTSEIKITTQDALFWPNGIQIRRVPLYTIVYCMFYISQNVFLINIIGARAQTDMGHGRVHVITHVRARTTSCIYNRCFGLQIHNRFLLNT